jgi:hypothetical protein
MRSGRLEAIEGENEVSEGRKITRCERMKEKTHTAERERERE